MAMMIKNLCHSMQMRDESFFHRQNENVRNVIVRQSRPVLVVKTNETFFSN